VSATLPKRFPLGLTLQRWRRLLAELLAMESDHGVHGAVPVEKQLERARAGEQLLVFIRCVVEESSSPIAEGELPDPSSPEERKSIQRDVPLSRAVAKYLLTACDRLRRQSLKDAWQRLRAEQSKAEVESLLDEVRLWDQTMRETSRQSGVIHPLAEMVAPLALGESELAQLGVPPEQLLNGQDLLAV
jgi:hypothetical protein